LIFLRSASRARDGASAGHHRLHVRLDHERLAELLHHYEDVGGPAAEPAVLFRQRRGKQAKFREHRPILLPCIVGGEHGAALVEIVLGGKPFRERLAQEILFVSEIEIHRSYSRALRLSPTARISAMASAPRAPVAKPIVARAMPLP